VGIIKVIVGGFVILLCGALVPQMFSVKLENYDVEKYRIAYEISRHPAFTKGDVEFYVCYSPYLYNARAATMPFFYPNYVFLSPDTLNDDFFDLTVAHELGHLEYGHGMDSDRKKNQMEADTFAAKIMGRERMRSYRLAQGFPYDHYLVKNLE
jgi:hypothetical protein